MFKYNNETYIGIIYGDLNGDGKINSKDLLKIKQHLLGTNILKESYEEAATIFTRHNSIKLNNVKNVYF